MSSSPLILPLMSPAQPHGAAADNLSSAHFLTDPSVPHAVRVGESGIIVFVSLALYVVFVTGFFFLAVSRAENHRVKAEVKDASVRVASYIDSRCGTADTILTRAASPDMRPNEALAVLDAAVSDNNASVRWKTWVGAAAVFLGFACVAAGIYLGMRSSARKSIKMPLAGKHYPSLVPPLIMSAMAFGVVVVTQVAFLFIVPWQYKSLPEVAATATIGGAVAEGTTARLQTLRREAGVA